MAAIPWTMADHQKLRELYPSRHIDDVVKEFPGRTVLSVKSRAYLLGLRKAIGFGAHIEWEFANDYLLRMYYPHVKTEIVAARLGATVVRTYNRANKLGLSKTAVYMASPDACRLRREMNPGIRYRFPKGNVPHNKGLRRPGWFSGRMRETQFKKGQEPRNAYPLWSFRVVDGYLMIKTGKSHKPPNTGWEYVHRLIWEHWNGPLPHWHVARIWWKDGDHMNCSLSNLELLSGADHVARTTVHNLPPELREVVQIRGAVNRAITMRSRREEQSQRSA